MRVSCGGGAIHVMSYMLKVSTIEEIGLELVTSLYYCGALKKFFVATREPIQLTPAGKVRLILASKISRILSGNRIASMFTVIFK